MLFINNYFCMFYTFFIYIYDVVLTFSYFSSELKQRVKPPNKPNPIGPVSIHTSVHLFSALLREGHPFKGMYEKA